MIAEYVLVFLSFILGCLVTSMAYQMWLLSEDARFWKQEEASNNTESKP